MTPRQRELARHALGLPNEKGRSYRNRFVTSPGTSDHAPWMEMVTAGEAEVHHDRAGKFGGADYFMLTLDGANKALDPKEILDDEDFPETDNVR